MQRIVIIDSITNIVDNITILAENSNWTPPDGYYAIIATDQHVGNTYNPTTGVFTRPNLSVPIDIPTLKNEYIDSINHNIGITRLKYITEIPGQQMTYEQKAFEVIQYSNDSSPDGSKYPYLQAEATATGTTLNDAYIFIKATSAAWNQLGAQLEGLRRGAIVAVENATDKNSIQNVMVNFENQLKNF